MTGNPGQAARFRPAPVAIHNDGEMLGEQVKIQFGCQFCLRQVVEARRWSSVHGAGLVTILSHEARMAGEESLLTVPTKVKLYFLKSFLDLSKV